MGCTSSKVDPRQIDAKIMVEVTKDESNGNVFITGYGPFRNIALNPSWQAVKSLPPVLDSYSIITREMPVIYSTVSTSLPPLLERYNPKLIIHVGCGSKDAIRLEHQAFNSGYIIKVNLMII